MLVAVATGNPFGEGKKGVQLTRAQTISDKVEGMQAVSTTPEREEYSA